MCFATDEDDRTAEWVRPCRCRGSTKWVHQACLQRWVDEKQRGNSTARVACPQCNAEYLIVFPKLGELHLTKNTTKTGEMSWRLNITTQPWSGSRFFSFSDQSASVLIRDQCTWLKGLKFQSCVENMKKIKNFYGDKYSFSYIFQGQIRKNKVNKPEKSTPHLCLKLEGQGYVS